MYALFYRLKIAFFQVLTEDNLDQLDKLYQAISPSRDDSGDEYPQRLLQASEHMVNILEGKDRQVLGTTYKDIKDLLTLINDCGYFERANKSGEEKGMYNLVPRAWCRVWG